MVALGAQRHRRHGDERRRRQGVQPEQVVAQRRRAQGEQDVVDRRVGGLADRPDPVQRPRLGSEPTAAGDGHVEDASRGPQREHGGLLAERLFGDPGQPRGQGGQVPPRVRGRAWQRRQPQLALWVVGRRSGRRGCRGCRGCLGRERHAGVPYRRIGGQAPFEESQRRHPVHHRVMQLGVDGKPPVGQSLDQVRLPQRPVPVEQRAVQPRDQREQFPDPARRRQGGVAYVVLQVDRTVVDPGPLAEGGKRPVRPTPKDRRDLRRLQRLPVQVGQIVGARSLGWGEQLQAADVHRLLTRLRDQEHRVRDRHQRHRSTTPVRLRCTRSLSRLLPRRVPRQPAGRPAPYARATRPRGRP